MKKIASHIVGDGAVAPKIRQAGLLLRKLADRRLAPLGLSSGHLPIIAALMRHGPLSQRALVEAVGLEQPTVAATLARMKRDGIIAKASDANDRRGYRYSLSDATETKRTEITRATKAMNEVAVGALDADDQQHLLASLDRIIASLRQEVDG